METIIQTSHLSKSFQQYKKPAGIKESFKSLFHRKYFSVDAVKDINLEIKDGEFVGFIGPNGAGKTTTLKMLAGLLYPSGGDIQVMGKTPFKREHSFLKDYALVMGQKSQLMWDLPPIETLELNKEIYEISDKKYQENLNVLSDLLKIKDVLEIPVRKLSLGQRMKCELATALIHQPKLLFLDEPTIGLDVVAQKNIRNFLKKYNEINHTTIILTSHYMDDVSQLCNRIVIISHGSLIYDGSLKNLTEKYLAQKFLKFIFKEKVLKKDLSQFGKIEKYSEDGLSVTLIVDRKNHLDIAAKALKSLPIDDLDIAEISLEEIIRHIFTSQ